MDAVASSQNATKTRGLLSFSPAPNILKCFFFFPLLAKDTTMRRGFCLRFSSWAMHCSGMPKKEVQESLYQTSSSVPLGMSMHARQNIHDLQESPHSHRTHSCFPIKTDLASLEMPGEIGQHVCFSIRVMNLVFLFDFANFLKTNSSLAHLGFNYSVIKKKYCSYCYVFCMYFFSQYTITATNTWRWEPVNWTQSILGCRFFQQIMHSSAADSHLAS